MIEVHSRSGVLLFVVALVFCSGGILSSNAENFKCQFHGQEVPTYSLCDGIEDCANGLDEHSCGNETVLFYTLEDSAIPSYKNELTNYSVGSYFLNEDLEGVYYLDKISTNYRVDSMALSGPYMYYVMNVIMSDPLESPHGLYSMLVQTAKNGTVIQEIHFDRSGKPTSHPITVDAIRDYAALLARAVGRSYVKQVAVDWITTNVYMLLLDPLLESAWIQTCSADQFFCAHLSDRLMKHPVEFAVAPEHGMLFWIELNSNSFIAKSQMDGLLPKVIQRGIIAPRCLTIDEPRNRLYWIDEGSLHSVTFSGDDKKTYTAQEQVNGSSIAVHDNKLYWINSLEKKLHTCVVENCSGSVHLRSLKSPESVLGIHKIAVDKAKMKNPCEDSVCSDICVLATNTTFSCACTADKSQLSDLSPNAVYCEKTTLLAAYGNDLYVVGRASSGLPRIRITSLKLNSISAIAYDSVMGRVILVEEERKIYSMNPSNHELTLLVSHETLSIKSVEFDEFGNNLYWLSPDDRSIKVFSLTTNTTAVIYVTNSTHVSLNFALAPNKRFIFIADLRQDSVIVLHRRSIDGTNKHVEIMYTMTVPPTDTFTFHYIRQMDMLFFIDKELGELTYFLSASDVFEIKFVDLSMDMHRKMSSNLSDSLASLDTYLFWTRETLDIALSNIFSLGVFRSEIDLVAFRKSKTRFTFGPVSIHPNHDQQTSNILVSDSQSTVFQIQNRITKDKNKTLSITGVIRAGEKHSPCLEDNYGKCQHVCLGSRSNVGSHVCVCATNYTLEPSGACRPSTPEKAAASLGGTSGHPILIFIFVVILLAVVGYVYLVKFDKIRRLFGRGTSVRHLVNEDDVHATISLRA